MSNKSTIEWTDATWNPVRGCTKISPGCKNCYASTFAERWRGVSGHAYEQGFDLRLVPHKLEEPLHWKKPARVFVNSMSDLFQEGVPLDYIDKVFAVMAADNGHTFQILTKRPEIMREYMQSHDGARHIPIAQAMVHAGEWPKDLKIQIQWPLPNVWLGVSVENQQYADERIPILLQTQAAVRFVSYEPALGPVSFAEYVRGQKWVHSEHLMDGWLNWIIVGGESGPGARPFNIEWARDVVAQCQAANVACFVKQLGAKPQGHYDPCLDVEWELLEKKEHPLYAIGLKDRKGGDPEEWPTDLRVRQYPEVRV